MPRQWVIIVLVVFALLVLTLPVWRYQYQVDRGVVRRIDRLTGQMCTKTGFVAPNDWYCQ